MEAQIDKAFKKAIEEASVSVRDENKTEEHIHITSKKGLDSYMMTVKSRQTKVCLPDDLWCPEFNEAIGEVLDAGAKKYAPRDWEQPDGYSMGYKSQCDAIFHHLAREFVYKENQILIDDLLEINPKEVSSSALEGLTRLLNNLKYDEIGTRHLQHAATRSVMSYTREKRGLE